MRRFRLSFFLFLALVLCGCSLSKKEKALSSLPYRSPHVLRINFQDGDLPSVHPHLGIDFRIRSLQTALFEGLTRVNPQGIPEPAAAERIEVSPDHTHYVFHIRQALWSNGEELSAFHFETAWKAALSPRSSCLRPDLLYVIKNASKAKKGEVSLDELGVKAIDAKTLVVDLEHPAPYFLDLVANPMYSPLYALNEEPVTFNGPFLISDWKKEQSLTLVPNPHYWDRSHIQLEKIEISIIKDPCTALALFEKGELDWIGSPFSSIPFEAIPAFRQSGHLKSKEVARVFWIYCNTQASPLHSSLIRKALSYAINRQAIAEHVLEGQLPTPSPLPNSLNLLEDHLLPLQGDSLLAKAFFEKGLEELHLTQQTFPKLTLSHSHISGQKQLAEAIQGDWRRVLGIEVEISGSEWNVFFSNLSKGQYQLGGCIKSAFFKDPLYHLELLKEKDHVYNVAKWENPLYQQLLKQAVVTGEETIRRNLLRQAEAILLEEMPVIPIYSEQYQYVLQPGVDGIVIHELGHVDFKWVDVRS